MATHVLSIDVPESGDLLAGRPFQEAGIGGVVESDFFDWMLSSPRGNNVVRRIALQVGRFRSFVMEYSMTPLVCQLSWPSRRFNDG